MGSAWRSVRYRVYQALRGFAALSPQDAADVRARLSRDELALFVAMDQRDRRHSVDLLRWLQRSGDARGTRPSSELERAALLHDVGKGSLWLWERSLFVVLNAISPALSRRLEREGDGPRGAFWRLRHHAEIGARLLTRAGTDDRVVHLVRSHIGPPGDDEELAWLQEADRAT